MPDVDAVISDVIETIARSATEIREGLVGKRYTVDEENPSGEHQARADVFADNLLAERLSAVTGVAEYASEEQTTVIDAGDGGVYVAADPLDGTSNLPANNPVGTVFGIYAEPLPASGRALLASGYVIYGPLTTMVCARDGTVTKYELSDGERTVISRDMRIPDDPEVYGFGGRRPKWTDEFRTFTQEIERELELHYSGAMIDDVNAVLSRGGIFAYPALAESPNGKLRLQFEGNPIGHIVETAGGRSSDGTQSLLDVTPSELHDRVPLHVGNAELIDRLEAALA